jgi:hypothetical protein
VVVVPPVPVDPPVLVLPPVPVDPPVPGRVCPELPPQPTSARLATTIPIAGAKIAFAI